MQGALYETVVPGAPIETASLYYPGIASRTVHPTVARFLAMSHREIAETHVRAHPSVDVERLVSLLGCRSRHLMWAGCDFIAARDAHGATRMLLIETNSCAAGHKAMPPTSARTSYARMLDMVLAPHLRHSSAADGDLAVLFDKNVLEARGYASALADLAGEPVHLLDVGADGERVRTRNERVEIDVGSSWRPLRAGARYVTERPWRMLPALCRTVLVNPVIACLAGARDKAMAEHAYAASDATLAAHGLAIARPRTCVVETWQDAERVLAELGGRGVLKLPHGHAGEGVLPIVTRADRELARASLDAGGRLVVQQLIEGARWRTDGLVHTGVVHDGETHAVDIRLIVASGEDGFRAFSMFARRAAQPLSDGPSADEHSRDRLVTNLSARRTDGGWTTDTTRLIPVDVPGLDSLGLRLEQLVEAFVAAVLAVLAIDESAARLAASDAPEAAMRAARGML